MFILEFELSVNFSVFDFDFGIDSVRIRFRVKDRLIFCFLDFDLVFEISFNFDVSFDLVVGVDFDLVFDVDFVFELDFEFVFEIDFSFGFDFDSVFDVDVMFVFGSSSFSISMSILFPFSICVSLCCFTYIIC